MDFDFKGFLEMMLLGSIAQQPDGDKAVAMLNVLKKHGISVMDGLAILTEISSVISKIEKKRRTIEVG